VAERERNGVDRDAAIMQHVDGELAAGEAAEVEAALARDPALRGKAEGVRELTELVRGHLELSADAAEPRFVALWSQIEKRIEHDRAPAKAKRASSVMEAAPASWWGRFGRWIDRRRGHILTGVASAGAVAAIALLIRGTADDAVVGPSGGAIPVVPVVDHTPPEVESLDVPEGSGTVFTIEDDDGDATVIWVTPADTVEGL
jgi:anti-sigma factor RsiW